MAIISHFAKEQASAILLYQINFAPFLKYKT